MLDAQTNSLLNKNWKIAELRTTLPGSFNTIYYNKDSVNNQFDYTAAVMTFANDGSYTRQDSPNDTIQKGTWLLSNTADSATIDGTAFLVTRLDSVTFETRGYSLQAVDTSGNTDSVFTYFRIYVPTGVLPVSLVNFQGELKNKLVQLRWST